MNLNYKLLVLMEECAEVSKAASKCIRFTWDENYPGYGINHQVLAEEVGDLLALIDSLPLDKEIIEKSKNNKINKVKEMSEKYPNVFMEDYETLTN